ncbi:MAG TPA: Uma2 family endonuclease, partial [Fimbriiglobus sp.]
MSSVATAPVPAKKLMTADEFLVFCERPENDDRTFELVRGEVFEMSLPTKMHGIVVSNTNTRLANYAEQIGPGYPVAGDSGVILERDPDTVRGPDVAYFIDVDNFEEVDDGWAETSPVLAIEVRSPNDKEKEIHQKVQEYLTAGVRVVWVV